MIKTITIIGAGNVATHLAIALHQKGYKINEILSKTRVSAIQLAKKVEAIPLSNFNELDSNTDLYIIAVNDDQIKAVSEQLNGNGIVVHTSGNTHLSHLSKHKKRGVFYPLQTFSKNKKIDFSTIPICIEGNNTTINQELTLVAQQLSTQVYPIDSLQREIIHLAAVFANNFTNHFYAIAADILNENGMDLAILKPLIQETATKILTQSPKEIQTGPAKRNDTKVLKNHIKLLKNKPTYQKIYALLSENIIQATKTTPL